MLAVTTVRASVSQPMMDISVHKYLLSLQIWPIAIYIRTACQCCRERHCYRVWSLPDISAVRKGVLSTVSENVPAFATVRICFSTYSYGLWWMRKHNLRNVQYQFILARPSVREDFITALCRVPELSLQPGLQRGGTTRHTAVLPLLTSTYWWCCFKVSAGSL
jgi:hypothetical protein